MSARKLGGLAGLVFVLAVVFGGVGAAASSGEQTSTAGSEAVYTTDLVVEWD